MVTAKDLLTPDFVELDMNDTAAKLISALHKANETFALVFDGDTYQGLVDKKWLLTSRIDSSKLKLSNLVKHRHAKRTPFTVPKLAPDTDLREICRLLETADVRALPVVEKDIVIGVVRAKEVVIELKKFYNGVPISDIATLTIHLAEENDPVGKIINALKEKKIDRMPIVDTKGKLVGIVSVHDILSRFHIWAENSGQHVRTNHNPWYGQGLDRGETTDLLVTPIKNIMTARSETACCTEKETVAQAIDLMTKNNVTSVILCREDVPFGILTVKDIFKDYLKA